MDWLSLPPGARRDEVAVPSGRLARIWMGRADAPRILLAPGVTGSKEDFILMMPRLAAAGYRVEAYDLAGQYESSFAGPARGGPYTMSLFTDDVLAMIGAGPTPVHLLGYSFAGTVAAQVAVDHPDLVASLTLLSAPPVPGQSLRRFRILGPLSGPLPGRAIGVMLVWALRHNLSFSDRARAGLVRTRLEITRTSSVGDVMELMKHTPDLSAPLRASGLPILVCAGSGDVWPLKYHRSFARACGARFAAFRTGHAVCETAPDQVVAEMLRMIGVAGPPHTAAGAGPSPPRPS